MFTQYYIAIKSTTTTTTVMRYCVRAGIIRDRMFIRICIQIKINKVHLYKTALNPHVGEKKKIRIPGDSGSIYGIRV